MSAQGSTHVSTSRGTLTITRNNGKVSHSLNISSASIQANPQASASISVESVTYTKL